MNKKQRTYSWEPDSFQQNLINARNRENKVIALVVTCDNEFGTYFLIGFDWINIGEENSKKIKESFMEEQKASDTELFLDFVDYKTGLEKTLKLVNEILQNVGFELEEKPKIPKEFEKLYVACKETSLSLFEEFENSLYTWQLLTPSTYCACQKDGKQLVFVISDGRYWRVSLNTKELANKKQSGLGEVIRLITTLFQASSFSILFPLYKTYADYLIEEIKIGPFENPEDGLEEIQHVVDKMLYEFGFILYPNT